MMYLKMCELAFNLQKEWKPEVGDKCNHPVYGIIIIDKAFLQSEIFQYKKSFVWMPRQDQLQRLINSDIEQFIVDFSEFMFNGYDYKFETLEEWYLSMYMFIKERKIWNNNKYEIV